MNRYKGKSHASGRNSRNQVNDCESFNFGMIEEDRNSFVPGNALNKQLSNPMDYSRLSEFTYLNPDNIPLCEDIISQRVFGSMQEKMGEEILSRVASEVGDARCKLVDIDGLEPKMPYPRPAEELEIWALDNTPNLPMSFELMDNQENSAYDFSAGVAAKQEFGSESQIESMDFSSTQSNTSLDELELMHGYMEKQNNEQKSVSGYLKKEFFTQKAQDVSENNNTSRGFMSKNVIDPMAQLYTLGAAGGGKVILDAPTFILNATRPKAKKLSPGKSERSKSLRLDDAGCAASASSETFPTRDRFEIKAIATGLCQLFPSLLNKGGQIFDIVTVKDVVSLPWPCNDPRGSIVDIAVQARNPFPKQNGKKQYDSCVFTMKMMDEDEIRLRVWSNGKTQAYGCKNRTRLIEANTIAVDLMRMADRMCRSSGLASFPPDVDLDSNAGLPTLWKVPGRVSDDPSREGGSSEEHWLPDTFDRLRQSDISAPSRKLEHELQK
eukprot:30143-Hanusia_phi.AAC.6